jgi:DNA-binding PadR family transcriptional regulator
MKKQKKAELLQGTLELLVLRLLQSGPLNGWDIMQRIRSTRRCIGWKRGGWWLPCGMRLRTIGGPSSTN